MPEEECGDQDREGLEEGNAAILDIQNDVYHG